jgi:hypothetical protein
MFSRLVSVVLFISGVVNPGQEQPPFSLVRVNAPGVQITDVGWATPPEKPRPDNTAPTLDTLRTPTAASGELPNPLDRERATDEWVLAPPARKPNPKTDYSNVTIYVGIRNSSVSDITAVEGKLTFADKRDSSRTFVIQFLSSRGIPHGKAVTLEQKVSFNDSWKQLQKAVGSRTAAVQVIINRVGYADGAEWRREQ